MRDLKFEYTQMSNINTSVDYISEKEVLEIIYKKVFDEKQASRKQKRDTAPGHNLFLTGITGNRKEAIQKDIEEKLPKGECESII